MANNKNTEQCLAGELLKKDVEHLSIDLKRNDDHDKEQDEVIKDLQKDMQDVKNVNTFLLKEVKEFIDVKKKINDIILKYVSKVFFTAFIVGLIALLINYKEFFLKFLKLD